MPRRFATHAGPEPCHERGRDWKGLFPQEESGRGGPCPAEDELVLQDNGFLSKNEVLRSRCRGSLSGSASGTRPTTLVWLGAGGLEVSWHPGQGCCVLRSRAVSMAP